MIAGQIQVLVSFRYYVKEGQISFYCYCFSFFSLLQPVNVIEETPSEVLVSFRYYIEYLKEAQLDLEVLVSFRYY